MGDNLTKKIIQTYGVSKNTAFSCVKSWFHLVVGRCGAVCLNSALVFFSLAGMRPCTIMPVKVLNGDLRALSTDIIAI